MQNIKVIPYQHFDERWDNLKADEDVLWVGPENDQYVDKILRISHVVYGVTQM